MFNLFGNKKGKVGKNSNRRVVNENGQVWCTAGEGHWEDPENFYDTKNECKKHYNEKQKEYKRNDIKARLRSAYKAQEERAGKLTKEDDLSVNDILYLLEANEYKCCAGGHIKFENVWDFEIAHIISPCFGGHLTLNNIQLTCHEHNKPGKAGQKGIMYMRVDIGCGTIGINANPREVKNG
jgi:hypothetical protein